MAHSMWLLFSKWVIIFSISGGSEANMDYTFPEGTAVEIAPGATFDMNSHYYNKGANPIQGEVYINLFTTNKANVKNTLKVLDLANNNLTIPPKKKTVTTLIFLLLIKISES